MAADKTEKTTCCTPLYPTIEAFTPTPPIPSIPSTSILCQKPWFEPHQLRAWTLEMDPMALTKGETEYFAHPCGCEDKSKCHVRSMWGVQLRPLSVEEMKVSQSQGTPCTHCLIIFLLGEEGGPPTLNMPGCQTRWRDRADDTVSKWFTLNLDKYYNVQPVLGPEVSSMKVKWSMRCDISWLFHVFKWASRSTKRLRVDFEWIGPAATPATEQQMYLNLFDAYIFRRSLDRHDLCCGVAVMWFMVITRIGLPPVPSFLGFLVLFLPLFPVATLSAMVRHFEVTQPDKHLLVFGMGCFCVIMFF